ncbi:unnamed protein product [Oikopleura dioica]|uniref:Uncharacterized protein n=1 Tax=Oikopleura dioica TaxID=34765 RepID=E4Y8R7_OIKDI|nr:unnamed protein product [Oikopleura dioica]
MTHFERDKKRYPGQFRQALLEPAKEAGFNCCTKIISQSEENPASFQLKNRSSRKTIYNEEDL